MQIEHSIVIKSDISRVWKIFTDLTCWKHWSTVLGDSSSEAATLTEGKSFKFCIRPFALPIHVEPAVDELIPGKRIVWSGEKYGIHARHEFIFTESDTTVHVLSREIFTAPNVRKLLFHIPQKKLHALAIKMLHELKEEAEKS